jgi:hypothetical protein
MEATTPSGFPPLKWARVQGRGGIDVVVRDPAVLPLGADPGEAVPYHGIGQPSRRLTVQTVDADVEATTPNAGREFAETAIETLWPR